MALPTYRKAICLTTLTVYTSMAAWIMHKSRSQNADKPYSSALSVLLGELLKISISVHFARRHAKQEARRSSLSSMSKSHDEDGQEQTYQKIFGDMVFTKHAWSMCIPASLYVLQNTLQLYSSSSLDPLMYQALSQLKIIAIGIFSIIFLRKRLTSSHWTAMTLLLVGIVILRTNGLNVISSYRLRPHLVTEHKFRRHIFKAGTSGTRSRSSSEALGIIAVSTSCILGSLAGVLLEKIIKSDKGNLWIANTQLSTLSLLPASILLLLDVYRLGFLTILTCFGKWAWLTVVVRAMGGILVGLVLKHADNILKSFATSSAILLSLFVSSIMEHHWPNMRFIVGSTIIVLSTIGYSFAEDNSRKLARSNESKWKAVTRDNTMA